MKDDDDIPSCKITLIGDSGVGKSSIIGRFITGFFNEEMNSTLGLNYSQKLYEKNGKKISLNLWDTAGQEKFRSLGKNFYNDSFIIIIVYDICNKASFQSINYLNIIKRKNPIIFFRCYPNRVSTRLKKFGILIFNVLEKKLI